MEPETPERWNPILAGESCLIDRGTDDKALVVTGIKRIKKAAQP